MRIPGLDRLRRLVILLGHAWRRWRVERFITCPAVDPTALLVDATRLVVWVTGATATAERLRAALTVRRGYVLSSLGTYVTLHIEETDAEDPLTVDGVMTTLEAYVMHEISQLSPTGGYQVLRAAGQNFNDAALRLIVPADDRWRVAVQEGTVNGLDRWRQARAKGKV